jgi:hypothetical protein
MEVLYCILAGVALIVLHDFNPIAPLLPWASWFGIG